MYEIRPGLAAIALAIIFPLAVEAGFRLERLLARRRAGALQVEGAGYTVSAVIGLLGLLIGFTFALASERFDTRRNLVVDEANAVSTTWLRQQMLEDPWRGRLVILMRDYVSVRQQFGAGDLDPRSLGRLDVRTAALQERIWQETTAALHTPSGAPLTVPLTQTTNQMFDLAASRQAANEARVPLEVILMLVVFATVAAMVMGYVLAMSGNRFTLVSTGVFVMAALAIAMILDLDGPGRGGIRIPQGPFDRVAAGILQSPPLP
jgi:hypothetical protein